MAEPSEITTLEGLRLAPASGKARQLVVLCHGLGVDANDMMPIARLLSGVLRDTAFAMPHAPLALDESLGPEIRKWFDLIERSVAEVEAGARAAAPALMRFVDAECARLGLKHRAVVLAGFSQGGMMALYTGLRLTNPPAGIVAFAGALPGAASTAMELHGRPPVLLVHGEQDDIVEVQMSRDSERLLRGLGVPVHAIYRPGLGHSIDNEGIGAFAAFCLDLAGGGRH